MQIATQKSPTQETLDRPFGVGTASWAELMRTDPDLATEFGWGSAASEETPVSVDHSFDAVDIDEQLQQFNECVPLTNEPAQQQSIDLTDEADGTEIESDSVSESDVSVESAHSRDDDFDASGFGSDLGVDCPLASMPTIRPRGI